MRLLSAFYRYDKNTYRLWRPLRCRLRCFVYDHPKYYRISPYQYRIRSFENDQPLRPPHFAVVYDRLLIVLSDLAEDENELMEEIHHDIETISLHEVKDQADTENAADGIDDNGSETLIDTQITYESQPSIKRNLTKKEIATTLIILKVRHKLTTRAVSDICRLLRLFHVPNAPKSFAAVKRLVEREASDNMKPDILHICHQCNNVYKDVCDDVKCQQNDRELQSAIFLKFPIKDQIQSILATERNFVLHFESPV
ncbi:unnamed protein product [Rotaria magnacalcarata]|uniref:Uncharacterized protein n=3 Tax=Rotaria magnacalcarata TaxID=392030 RepID=A0A814NMY1_9BILA|nr:unnamed protein product [Rotaria magnacalcarata]